jgi:hypothetical protein
MRLKGKLARFAAWSIAFVVIAGAVIATYRYASSRPTVFQPGTGLQAADTEFQVSSCRPVSSMFPPGSPSAPPPDELLKPGLNSVGWDEHGRLTVAYGVETDCETPFNYGGYKLSGNELHLEYGVAPGRVAACSCGYRLEYRISGLQKRDYVIDLHRNGQ